ncbi:hypothetical protein, partial [Rhizobium tibeticum]|uniref:hypothetical protein n=1 Tax=Rhizobium tibeticum TaxID=501024 RepID=UPI001AECC546
QVLNVIGQGQSSVEAFSVNRIHRSGSIVIAHLKLLREVCREYNQELGLMPRSTRILEAAARRIVVHHRITV